MDSFTGSCHEVGHALATILSIKKHALFHVTIESRRHYKQENLTSNEFPNFYYHNFVKPKYYAFGLTCSIPLEESYNYKFWSRSDFQNHLVQLFAGGITEDLSKNITPRIDEKSIKQDLANFKHMPSVKDDKEKIEALAKLCVSLQCVKDGFCFDSGYVNQAKLSQAQEELEQEAFQEARILVALHQRKIKKIALKLQKKKILDGQEVYKELGIERPLYDFERKQDNNNDK